MRRRPSWCTRCGIPHLAREDEMATARKIDVLTVKLDPKPGALAQVLSAFREAKVNVTASWAYQMGPGEAQAHFFTADLDRAKQALNKLGKAPKTEAAFWVEDADKIGNYHSVLEKIAKAGINIEDGRVRNRREVRHHRLRGRGRRRQGGESARRLTHLRYHRPATW